MGQTNRQVDVALRGEEQRSAVSTVTGREWHSGMYMINRRNHTDVTTTTTERERPNFCAFILCQINE